MPAKPLLFRLAATGYAVGIGIAILRSVAAMGAESAPVIASRRAAHPFGAFRIAFLRPRRHSRFQAVSTDSPEPLFGTASSDLQPAPKAAPSAGAASSSHRPVSGKVAARSHPVWNWRRLDTLPSRGDYRRSYRVMATAYMPIHRGIEGGRYTCTLKDGRASHGVAVDPHIIPLGTQLWIPGYGPAVADDVGSMIKGHHVDVRVQNREQMQAWGSKQIRVYVLAEAPGADD